MSKVLIGNLPPGTTIRNIDDFCSPFGRLLYVDVKMESDATFACVEYENTRNAINFINTRQGCNIGGHQLQFKLLDCSGSSGNRGNERTQAENLQQWSNNHGNNQAIYSNKQESFSFTNSKGGNRTSDGYKNQEDLDFNDACRIVYERFIKEGYSHQVAKQKSIDFVINMQRGSTQNSGNLNTDSRYAPKLMENKNQNWVIGDRYEVDNRGTQMRSSAYSNNYANRGNFQSNIMENRNQNWRVGNDSYDFDNSRSKTNSNSNYNYNSRGPQIQSNLNCNSYENEDQEMPSNCIDDKYESSFDRDSINKRELNSRGPTSYGIADKVRFSGHSRRDRDDMPSTSKVQNKKGYLHTINKPKDVVMPTCSPGIGISLNDYNISKIAAVKLRNKYKKNFKEATRVALQKHQEIIQDYMHYNEAFKRAQNTKKKDETIYQFIDRYIAAKAICSRYMSSSQDGKINTVTKKAYISSKAIIDEYEQSRASNKMSRPSREFMARKLELLKDAPPVRGEELTRDCRKVRKTLMYNGVGFKEANKLAAHYPKHVIDELIELRNCSPKLSTNKFTRLKNHLLAKASKEFPNALINPTKSMVEMLTKADVDENEAKILSQFPSDVIEKLISLKNASNNEDENLEELEDTLNHSSQSAQDNADIPQPKEINVSLPIKSKIERLQASYETDQVVLQKFKAVDIAKLGEKQKAAIRIALRRVRLYHRVVGGEIPKNKFDVLLANDDEDDI